MDFNSESRAGQARDDDCEEVHIEFSYKRLIFRYLLSDICRIR